MTCLLTELINYLREKQTPPTVIFFRPCKNTDSLKWQPVHQIILNALQKKDYAAFHIKWQQWERANLADDIDSNIGVYFGFIDECLLLYARTIKQCLQKGYDWVDAYPTDIAVLENNYTDKLTQLQYDKDEEIDALRKMWKEERSAGSKKENVKEESGQKVETENITDPVQMTGLEAELSQNLLTFHP